MFNNIMKFFQKKKKVLINHLNMRLQKMKSQISILKIYIRLNLLKIK